jgi:glutamate/tyrosine decarboxylase-like PLP-dependent enzyme
MSSIENNLARLESAARQLEPDRHTRKKIRKAVVGYSEEFLEGLASAPTYRQDAGDGRRLLKSPIAEKGISIRKAVRLIRENLDRPALNPASGGHLGYIPGGGLYYSSLGDYLADVTNRYAGIYFAGPGAVRMENMLIRWVASLMGYPKNCGGNLCSGGSIANLIGICTARDAKKIGPEKVRMSVIYLSSQAHHSVDKAIRIAGLGQCVIRRVPVDDKFRIRPDAMADRIIQDRRSGLNPFLLIASAGTTDVGAVDPLGALGAIARKNKLWYHIDAAYGGFFVLTKEGKKMLKGIEMSDSLVIDPHKGLFLPYGLGMVLVKNIKQMHATHHYQANYMQDAVASEDEPSPAELSPELTKHFRGLRLWLPLKLHGLKPFRAGLEEKLLLARYFEREVKRLGFETGGEPELSVVTYRYVPPKGDANAFNKQLLDRMHKDGRVFISSTLLNGQFTLRFACLCFRTHRDTVDLLLKMLRKHSSGLLRTGKG